MGAVKKVLFVLVLGILFFPQFQGMFTPISSDGLKGAFVPAPRPRFSFKSWNSGLYQDSLGKNLNDSLPFRPDLVRLNNQLDYSLFNIPHGKNVVVGKHGNLFLEEYIDGYLGKGFQSKRFMADKIRMLKKVQEILWKQKKIFLLVVIPPDKATFACSDIPDSYLQKDRDTTSRKFLLERLQSAGIHVIDFMPVFLKMKDTVRYPLFVKTGIHWSDYGSFLAADSIFRYITDSSGYRFPAMKLAGFDISSSPRHDDDDITRTMNLIWTTGSGSTFAYPVITYSSDTGFRKPSALFVGDSFYWGLYNQGIIGSMFSNIEYWFYDHLVFPEAFKREALTSELDLREAIEQVLSNIHLQAIEALNA
jgi:hypothetical protein